MQSLGWRGGIDTTSFDATGPRLAEHRSMKHAETYNILVGHVAPDYLYYSYRSEKKTTKYPYGTFQHLWAYDGTMFQRTLELSEI